MVLQEQRFWGDVSWQSKMQKNQGRLSDPPPCPTLCCISIIPKNNALQPAWHLPVLLRRLCLQSGVNGAVRTVVLGWCQLAVQSAKKIKGDSVVHSPVQLYDASALLLRIMPYRRHGIHLWCWGGCACNPVSMVLWEQRFWGNVSWQSIMQNNQGRLSGPPPCPTLCCIGALALQTQNNALQPALHSPVMRRRLCLQSGVNGAARTAVLGWCQLAVQNAKNSRETQWSTPLSNFM